MDVRPQLPSGIWCSEDPMIYLSLLLDVASSLSPAFTYGNDLPVNVTSALSLVSFRKMTKTASVSTFISWRSLEN